MNANLSYGPLMREIYGHDLYEYLLVARPDTVVNEKVIAEQQLFYDDYKQKAAVEIKPHINIASFFAKEEMEETFLRWMQRICNKQESFIVTLNNYGGFPPDTIYLRIQNETPFRQLAKELKVINAYVSSGSCPPMLLTHRPHVSIAGKLPGEVFSKALTQYAHKSFHESFLVKELLLMKRKHEYDNCKPVIVFALKPAENQFAH
ncbi:MAG: 2'-5' RNA ligase family protein [Ginsengibacter sp.]